MYITECASIGRERSDARERDFARALYHAIWVRVGAHFFDETRLADWGTWEHRHDDRIVDERSALRYARRMVASLGDKYTCILSPKQLKSRHKKKESTSAAVRAEHLPGNIGCITILSFSQDNVIEQFTTGLEKLADCDGLVIVLNNNRGGQVDRAIDCLEPLIEEGGIVSLEIRGGLGITTEYVYFAPHASLIATMAPDGKETIKRYHRKQAVFAGKPMSLVMNGDTASAAELFAAALICNGKRTGRCRSFGTRTFGKGITQAPFELFEGRATVQISTGRVLSPERAWFGDAQSHCPGIDPGVVIDGDAEAVTAACEDLRQRVRQLKYAA